MKTIDLPEIDETLRKMMAEFGYEKFSRCVDIEYWNHGNGRIDLNFRVSAFYNEKECEVSSGITPQLAIDALRIKLRVLREVPVDGEVEVIVPEVVN